MINYSNIFVKDGLTYEAYKDFIKERLAAGKTTGQDDSEAMLHYTKMNLHRMGRVDKSVQLNEEFLSILKDVKNNYRLLVITEGWCGDAAQLVSVFDKIVKAAPEHFELRFVLRDQQLELIDAHLTNGGRSIPVLLVLNEQDELMFKWGPRPALVKPLLADWNKESDDIMVTAEKLHGWYAKDKTRTTQQELIELFKTLG
ncbi:thioredoxin family protein [Pedobacter immunditicola]|uniref:thioredoxin family protein n=1 Tax=Pedobacter immunditicola TaxID=3133440 RepID=UPI00309D1B17